MAENNENKGKKAKHAGGRPRKYESVVKLQAAIDEYFEVAPGYTITGLALHLGFTSRLALIANEGYSEEFFYALKRAKLRIEMYYEQHLVETGAAGSIFALKNFGWSDKQEIVQERTQSEQIEVNEIQERIKLLEDAGDGIPN